VPIVDNLNGFQSDPKFRLLAGVSFDLGRKRPAH